MSDLKIKYRLAKHILSWVAMVVTQLPYRRKVSLLLDKLLALAEGQ